LFQDTNYRHPRLLVQAGKLPTKMYELFDAIPKSVEDVQFVSVETLPLPENIRRSFASEATRDVPREELKKLHAAFKRREAKPTTKTTILKPRHMLAFMPARRRMP
jgi:hypothetical protein